MRHNPLPDQRNFFAFSQTNLQIVALRAKVDGKPLLKL
jgi:hypothetical protein